MNRTFQRVLELVARDEVRISVHGYDELAADGIRVREVLNGVSDGIVVIIPSIPKGSAYWFFSGIQMRGRFMLCGESLAVRIPRQFL